MEKSKDIFSCKHLLYTFNSITIEGQNKLKKNNILMNALYKKFTTCVITCIHNIIIKETYKHSLHLEMQQKHCSIYTQSDHGLCYLHEDKWEVNTHG